MALELPEVQKMTTQERLEALDNVAIQTEEQLIKFLHASERTWLVLNTEHLVRAVPFPDGDLMVQQILAWYRNYRATVGTGRKQTTTDQVTGAPVVIEEGHGEALEIAEAEDVIRFLLDMIRERDPTWTLARL